MPDTTGRRALSPEVPGIPIRETATRIQERDSANRRARQTAGGSDQRPRQGIACHRPLAGDGASPRPLAASTLSGRAMKGKHVGASAAGGLQLALSENGFNK